MQGVDHPSCPEELALRALAKGYSWIYPMTNANIYPTLRTLEEEGFVEHHSEVHDGRLRKIYAITDAGLASARNGTFSSRPRP